MFNFTYEDLLLEKDVNTKELNTLVEQIIKKKVYMTLIFMDFTYLNKKYGYNPGDLVKEVVLNIINRKKKEGEIIYYSITSSKIYLFSKSPLSKQTKQVINDVSKKVLVDNKYDFGDKKIVFIVDKNKNLERIDDDNEKEAKSNKNNFTIGPFNQNIYELFNEALNIEINLSDLRDSLQAYFHRYQDVKSRADLKKLNCDQIKIIEKFNVDFNRKKHYKLKINEDLQNVKEFIRTSIFNEIEQKVKNSQYLNNFLLLLKKSVGYSDPSYYINEAYKDVVKYFIWNEMQKLQFIGFKIEKIYTFFNRKEDEDFIVGFQDKEDLINWYNSSIKYLEQIGLKEQDKDKAQHIKSLIEQYNPNDKKICILLKNAVQNFTDHLSLKGVFNIPLEKVTPGIHANSFFKDLLFVNFGSNYKGALRSWLDSGFVKEGFYVFVKSQKLLYQGINFINKAFLSNVPQNTQVKVHLAFLEIDGFNAFNTFYYPNDNDEIIYKKMLDKMFEVIQRYFYNSQTLYKDSKTQNNSSYFSSSEYVNDKQKSYLQNNIMQTFCAAAMGDEFFFSFVTKGDITREEEVFVVNLLNDIRQEMLKIASQITFPKTKKIHITTKNGEVTFRKIITNKKEGFLARDDIGIKIGKIGVSGVCTFNHKYNYKEENHCTIFEKQIKSLENSMDDVKKFFEGKLIEVDTNWNRKNVFN